MAEEANDRLEELQTRIRLEVGSTATQQELRSRLTDGADDPPTEVVESFGESTVPLSGEQNEAMRGGQFSPGVETEGDDTDDSRYG